MRLWHALLFFFVAVMLSLVAMSAIVKEINQCRDKGGDRFYCITGMK